MLISGEILLKPAVIAKKLKKDYTTVMKWIYSGKLKAVPIGDPLLQKRMTWLVRESEYDKFTNNYYAMKDEDYRAFLEMRPRRI